MGAVRRSSAQALAQPEVEPDKSTPTSNGPIPLEVILFSKTVTSETPVDVVVYRGVRPSWSGDGHGRIAALQLVLPVHLVAPGERFGIDLAD